MQSLASILITWMAAGLVLILYIAALLDKKNSDNETMWSNKQLFAGIIIGLPWFAIVMVFAIIVILMQITMGFFFRRFSRFYKKTF